MPIDVSYAVGSREGSFRVEAGDQAAITSGTAERTAVSYWSFWITGLSNGGKIKDQSSEAFQMECIIAIDGTITLRPGEILNINHKSGASWQFKGC